MYRFSDAEKDAWANLFAYKGSEQQVWVRFSIDRIGAGLADVNIVPDGRLDKTKGGLALTGHCYEP